MFTDLPIMLSRNFDPFSSSLFDQFFGMGVHPEDLSPMLRIPYIRSYLSPRSSHRNRETGMSHISSNNNEFKVSMDVQHFKPEQLNVKVADNSVIVEGKHEERQDEHGYICRQFRRRYLIPDDVDPATIVSSLSSDGVLSVSAPKKIMPAAENERMVPIVQTHQPVMGSKAGSEQQPPKVTAEGEKMEP